MFHFSKRAFAVVLCFCAPGVLPLTITGPTSAQSSGSITFTWTSVFTDPPFFEIDIDVQLDSLKQTDPYRIFNGVVTADGSVTFTLPALSVGTHRVAFSNTNGSVILTTGSIEILAAASSSIPSSSVLFPSPARVHLYQVTKCRRRFQVPPVLFPAPFPAPAQVYLCRVTQRRRKAHLFPQPRPVRSRGPLRPRPAHHKTEP
ncbi:hypothetical protein B0H13DRAFT_222521 [Mycena leptocephala]|nr:hypothetical protein B0H13DRAFT_222521 [Mycena leptocephala]